MFSQTSSGLQKKSARSNLPTNVQNAQHQQNNNNKQLYYFARNLKSTKSYDPAQNNLFDTVLSLIDDDWSIRLLEGNELDLDIDTAVKYVKNHFQGNYTINEVLEISADAIIAADNTSDIEKLPNGNITILKPKTFLILKRHLELNIVQNGNVIVQRLAVSHDDVKFFKTIDDTISGLIDDKKNEKKRETLQSLLHAIKLRYPQENLKSIITVNFSSLISKTTLPFNKSEIKNKLSLLINNDIQQRLMFSKNNYNFDNNNYTSNSRMEL